MLRLPTTKIDLGPRDLAWHIDRYRQRKAQYEEVRQVSGSERSAHHASKVQSTRVPVRSLPHQQGYVPQATGILGVDDALVSREPVPRDSRTFWNGVLAMAGTSMQNLESLPHERYSDNEPTASSSESHHTSIPSDPSSGFDEQEVLQQGHERDRGRNAHDLRDVVEAGTRLAALRSQFSTNSSQSSENGKEDVTNNFVDLEAGRGATPIRRRAFFNFRRAEHDGGIDEDISNLSRSFSSQLDFGGSNETMPKYDDHEEEEDLAIAQAVPINRYVPRPVLQHTTSRLRGRSSQMEDEEAELAETIAGLHELIDGAASPAPRLSAPVELIRSRSGTIARSPLYLSHAVASSSPEKPGTVSPYHTHSQPVSTTSLLSLPPRRAKQYIPKSDSSIGSKASHDSDDPRVFEGIARQSYQSIHPKWDEMNDLPKAMSYSNKHPIDSPFPPSRTRGSPAHSFTSTPPQLALHSVTAPPRPSPPQLPPLPPPFSSTRRLLSFNLALPSSSPINPFTSPAHPPPSASTPPRRNPPPHAHHTNLSPTRLPSPRHSTPSPSPSPPSTPHRSSMRIYNDALPPTSQPQTPLGLPRHGVYTSNGLGGYYTAPAQEPRHRGPPPGGGHATTRAVATSRASPWHAPATATTTPTRTRTRTSWLRGSRGGRASAREMDEQENVGVWVEAERRLRWRAGERERELEMGRAGEGE